MRPGLPTPDDDLLPVPARMSRQMGCQQERWQRLCGLLCLSSNVTAFRHSPQTINSKLLELQTRLKNHHPPPLTAQDSNEPVTILVTAKEFPEQWFAQPVDHFAKDSPTFGQRYWINKRHYAPGTNAPVIVIDGGKRAARTGYPSWILELRAFSPKLPAELVLS